jgi:LacI family transcriptional regulator, repressor for deo operon, udp, cdd, tsx, nupC, and nupG
VAVNKTIVFVSYANLPITSYTAFPPLASVEQYPYGQGEKAMQLMIKILSEKQTNNTAQEIFYTEELSPTLVAYQQTIN